MKLVTAMNPRNLITVGFLTLSFLFLQGCSAARTGITIDSSPQGADIIADGKNIGKTPMQIKQDSVFPPHWYGRSYMVKGQLELKKEGCEMVSMEVNDQVLSKDIVKQLDCQPGAAKMPIAPIQEKPATEKPVAEKPDEQMPMTQKSTEITMPVEKSVSPNNEIESRLNRLTTLRDKGVINDKEYSEQRQRILESL